MAFKKFHKQFVHLDIQEAIEFYSVFDGYPFLDSLKLDDDLSTCMQKYIIDRADELKVYFVYDESMEFQKDLESILTRIAIGDRKNYTVYKKENISQLRGRSLYRSLFEKSVIKKEISREKPLREFKAQRIKKSLRRYKVQDKIRFCNNFTRFWFTYIAPNYDKPLHVQKIMQKIEQHVSLSFEELSDELVVHRCKDETILSCGSYWDKDIEIDLLVEAKSGIILAGESKWKNHKVCKNILKSLQKKCERAKLKVDCFVLCSKSGFSKELMSIKSDRIMLVNLKDFEELY